jgi:hypothetical protein
VTHFFGAGKTCWQSAVIHNFPYRCGARAESRCGCFLSDVLMGSSWLKQCDRSIFFFLEQMS